MKTATKTAMKTCTAVAVSMLLAGFAGVAAAATVPGQGTWETTLQARDLDGDNVTDAFYDTALNVTWLRNANVNGQMNWNDANAWATDLVVGAYSDWRLPTMLDTAAPGCDFVVAGGSDCGYNVQTQSGATVFSEMAHLYQVTLGNKALYAPGTNVLQPGWGLTNTGDFQDMQSDFYWSGLDYAPDANYAWHFSTIVGYQGYFLKSGSGELSALAVRSGDVAAAQVPEPGTPLLAALAFAAMGIVSRRRTARASVL